MNRACWLAVIYGVSAGVILAYIQLVAYYLVLPYAYDYADWIVGVAIVVSTAIAVLAVCVKSRSGVPSMLRWLIVAISFTLMVVLNGYMGTANLFLSGHEESISVASENVIGLLIAITTTVAFAISFATTFIRTVSCIFLRLCKK